MNETEPKVPQEVSYPDASQEIKQLLADINLAAGQTFLVAGTRQVPISLAEAIKLALASQNGRLGHPAD